MDDLAYNELKWATGQARNKALEDAASYLKQHGIPYALPGPLFHEWVSLEKDLFDADVQIFLKGGL